MPSLPGKCWWTISVSQCALLFSLLYMITISTSVNSSSLELCARLDCSLKTHCKHTQSFQEWMYLARFFRSESSMLSARPSNPKFCCPRIINFSEKVGVWISSSIFSRSRFFKCDLKCENTFELLRWQFYLPESDDFLNSTVPPRSTARIAPQLNVMLCQKVMDFFFP